MAINVATARRVFEEMLTLGSSVDSVDTEKGIIKNCRVCGTESRNNARILGLDEAVFGDALDKTYGYTERALRTAVSLYEGATVYDGHLQFWYDPDGKRRFSNAKHDNDSVVGFLENAKYIYGKGIYADLHYLKSSHLGEKIAEVAKRRPDQYSLSHEATFGEVKLIGGRAFIDEIKTVEGVALINGEAGTVNGLFEGDLSVSPYDKPGTLFEAFRKGPPPLARDPLDKKYADHGSLVRAMRNR